MRFFDRLTNLISGLGTVKDKSTATSFGLQLLSRAELEAMYRSDWLARKIVDIIPFDMTREWRTWQAQEAEIEAIEAEESRLGVRNKVAAALQRARLYGGAAIYLGTKDARVDQPLDVERLDRGGLSYLHILSPHHVTTGELDRDPLSPFFGEPANYQMQSGNGAQVTVHSSRLIRFVGAELPDPFDNPASNVWGDPILQVVYDALQNASSTQQHVAALLPELKMDVISVPQLSEYLSTKEGTQRIQDRFANANLLKSMHNMLLLEGGPEGQGEEWQTRQIQFTQFPELIRTYLQVAAGAADIPATRLLGQAPSGLNATGDADVRNYYDRVAAQQRVELGPRLNRLDECLIRSALGSHPPAIFYEFAPLWQMTDAEKADVGVKFGQMVTSLVNTGTVPPEVLEVGVRNRLIEDGPFPGIETAYADFDRGALERLVEPEPEPAAGPAKAPTNDAAPHTLYVRRDVTNAAEIIKWFKGQGFETTLSAGDLHVTIAFSREPVDWMTIGEAWASKMQLTAGGPRVMERFGDATVMLFKCAELDWRHRAILEAGASWDHNGYQPHITISYNAGDLDLEKVEPFQGQIELGPEIFEEVDENWSSKLSEDQEGDPQGKGPFEDAGFDPSQPCLVPPCGSLGLTSETSGD